MAEEFPSFDLGFYFLNYQNAEAGNSPGDTATDQKKRFADVTETEKSGFIGSSSKSYEECNKLGRECIY